MTNIKTTFRAASLFNALLISLLIAMVCAGMISTSYYHRVLNQNAKLQTDLLRNANSGISLLKAQKKSTFDEVIDLFDNQMDSVRLVKYSWGFFDVMYSEAFHHNFRGRQSFRKGMFTARRPNEVAKSALYLKDSFKPLTLSGDTRINGTVWLPKAGVKSGYVDGRVYRGDQLIYGAKKESKAELPPLNKNKIENIRRLFFKKSNFDFYASSEAENSFYEETLFFRDSLIYLNEQSVKGNICLIADSLIYVGRNTRVEDVILIAPEIYFEPGFIGNAQAFAFDKMEVDRDVVLNYPSVVALLQSDFAEDAAILKIGEASSVSGFVLAYDGRIIKPAPKVFLFPDSEIKGQVYANGSVDCKGNVFGNMTCKNFSLRAGTSLYENHLLDVEFSVDKRSGFYLSPCVFEGEVGVLEGLY